MPRFSTQQIDIDTQLPARCGEPIVGGTPEQNIEVRLHGEPTVFGHFCLELTRGPTGIAQCDQIVVGPLAGSNGAENIP